MKQILLFSQLKFAYKGSYLPKPWVHTVQGIKQRKPCCFLKMWWHCCFDGLIFTIMIVYFKTCSFLTNLPSHVSKSWLNDDYMFTLCSLICSVVSDCICIRMSTENAGFLIYLKEALQFWRSKPQRLKKAKKVEKKLKSSFSLQPAVLRCRSQPREGAVFQWSSATQKLGEE